MATLLPQTVIERERDARAAVPAAAAHDVLKRHHRKDEAQHAQLPLERRRVRRGRAVVHEDAVVRKAQHARILSPGVHLEWAGV